MNFVLGWELSSQRVAEYAREYGLDKDESEEVDDDDNNNNNNNNGDYENEDDEDYEDDEDDTVADDDADDDDDGGHVNSSKSDKEAVRFFTVVGDIHSRTGAQFFRFRACWDADGNLASVFALYEEEADRLVDISCTSDDFPPQKNINILRSLLNHPDPSPKWYVHATQWPGSDRLRAALGTTGDDAERDSKGEGAEVGGDGDGEETEVEDEHTKETPKVSADVRETTSQIKELRI